jgi:predicted metal-binding protein
MHDVGRKMIKLVSRKIERMAMEHGFIDFRWINPRRIVTGNWVRMKCQFGCDGYGKGGCCPPEAPSVTDCRKFFDEYKVGLLLHCAVKFENPLLRRRWSRATQKKAVALEREVFLADYPKAFVFPPGGPCRICASCSANRRECKNPYAARPSLEAFAVDVYSTARKMRYPIHVLKGYGEEMNRFGLLLVE